MNTKRHYQISRIGYVFGLAYIFLFGIRYIWFYPDPSEAFIFILQGVFIIVISFIYSKLWSLTNTVSYIEEQLEAKWKN